MSRPPGGGGRRRRAWIVSAWVTVILSFPVTVSAQTVEACVPGLEGADFDDLPAGTQYFVGDPLSSGGIDFSVEPFTYTSGETTSDGSAVVDPIEPFPDVAMAGGSGLELNTNNVRLVLAFGGVVDRITLRFGDHGGNVNLELNGSFANLDDFSELDGQTLGGVRVSVLTGIESNVGTMTLEGRIGSFALGGQELWIDDVVPESFCPDLAIDSFSHLFVERGSRVEFTVVVRNIGDAGSAGTDVTVTSPAWEPARELLGRLGVRGAQELTLSMDVPEAQRGRTVSFTVDVDPSATVVETTDANNRRTIPNVPVPAAELAVTVGTPTIAGDQLVVPITVSNTGGAFSTRTTVLATAEGWDGSPLPLDRLHPGASTTLQLEMAIPEDRRGSTSEFTVRVDPDELVPGNDPSNDTAVFSVEVPSGEPPDGNGGFGWLAIVLGALAGTTLVAAAVWSLVRRPVGRPGPVQVAPVAIVGRPVRVGFAPADDPSGTLGTDASLAVGRPYLLWAEVGSVAAGDAQRAPDGVGLVAAVFAPRDGLRLERGAEVGALVLEPDGRTLVTRQPAPQGPSVGPSPQPPRLWFPVASPDREGIHQVRFNLYDKNVLVHSERIRVAVSSTGRRITHAIDTDTDYTIAPRLDPAHLLTLPHHRLSVFVNRNADGTHGFSFFGEGAFKNDASFDGLELQDLIRQARGALRQAAWGSEREWDGVSPYRYDAMDPERLRVDLTHLAIRGFRFYAAILDRLAGGTDGGRDLTELMRTPGLVQIASKDSPTHILPAALLYDYVGFDSTARLDEYRLCPAFLSSSSEPTPLEEGPCFQGLCPSRGAETTICPSGFWGYRHSIGMPVTVGEAPEVPVDIDVETRPVVAVAVSTDPEFRLREEHCDALRRLCPDCDWSIATTREDALQLLRAGTAHLVYLYCHGGMSDGVPYFQVGPTTARGITADFLFTQGIRWTSPRALVFINGCRTTALEPERALEFVSALVKWVRAAGVIGTEITVFEPLARAFAEETVGRFLGGDTIGSAVRSARLAVLKQGNPLGLAYIPFALAGLQMVRRPAEADHLVAVP